MNEKQNIIKALKSFKSDKIRIENLKEIILATTDSKQLELLENELRVLNAKVTIIERCIDKLTTDEKQVLKKLYIDREYKAAEKAAMKLAICRTQVYLIRDSAIDKIKVMLN